MKILIKIYLIKFMKKAIKHKIKFKNKLNLKKQAKILLNKEKE